MTMEWVVVMNSAMFLQLDLDSPSRQGRSDDYDDDSNDSNWTSRGMRKSGRDYDEIDSGKEIAYFLDAHQEHNDLTE